MRRFVSAATLAAIGVGVFGCGGYGGSSPTSPDVPSALPAGAIAINVVGIDGAQSFSPNPATVPAGQTVVWHNVDTVTHRVVLDDGKLDTGNIAPGAFSQPMTLVAPGGYHCSIHPPMVGTIVGAAPATTSSNFTIHVAEINGPYSFYPSPATVGSGQVIVWRNDDIVTHHVVFDNISVDTGTLAPGTLSQPMKIGPGTWSYHCAIHPEMVGSVTVPASAN
jgi:plastocyanin